MSPAPQQILINIDWRSRCKRGSGSGGDCAVFVYLAQNKIKNREKSGNWANIGHAIREGRNWTEQLNQLNREQICTASRNYLFSYFNSTQPHHTLDGFLSGCNDQLDCCSYCSFIYNIAQCTHIGQWSPRYWCCSLSPVYYNQLIRTIYVLSKFYASSQLDGVDYLLLINLISGIVRSLTPFPISNFPKVNKLRWYAANP